MKKYKKGSIIVFYSSPRMGERNFKPSQYYEAVSFTAEKNGSMLIFDGETWKEAITEKV